MGAALGFGDMRRLLASSNPVLLPFGAVEASTPFGEFTSSVTGRCDIFCLVDTNGVHLELTALGTTGSVDGGQYIPVGAWQLYEFDAVAGQAYSFQVTKGTNLAMAVVYSPLMS